MWCCCEQTLTFGVRFAQHGDGCGAAVKRPLPLLSDLPSMEMDVGLLWTDPYLWCRSHSVWRWMWCCCEQTLTFGVRFAQHGDGCVAAVNRPLPLVSDSPSMEMDMVLVWTDPYLYCKICTQHGDGCGATVNRPLTFGVRFAQHGDGCGAVVNRTFTFGVRFTQHGDGCGAGVNRTLPLVSDLPSMEMDVVLLWTDPYLWCQICPAWRWMWGYCEQTLTFGVGFTQHGDGCGAAVNRPLTFGVRFAQHGDGCGAAVNRPLPLVSDSPSMEMDVVLLWTDPLPLVSDLPSMEMDVVLVWTDPLPLVSDSPSMEMDVVLLWTDPYLWCRIRPAWRWMWCCCGSSRISPSVRTPRSWSSGRSGSPLKQDIKTAVRDTRTDSKGYIARCLKKTRVHIAQTRTRIPTPYFCIGQESKSRVRIRQCNWVTTLFIYAWRRSPKCFNSRERVRNLPVDWTISP